MDLDREIQELLEEINRVPIEDLLREIAESPIPFLDYEPIPKPRRTRRKQRKAF